MCMNDIDICRFLVIIVGVYQLFTSCKNCTDPSYGLQGPWFLMLYAPFMQLRLFSFSGVSNDHLAVNTFNLIYMMPGHTHIRDCGERSDQTHEASVLSALLVQLDGRSMSLESGALYGDCWLDEYVSHAVLAWTNPSVPIQVSSLMMTGVNPRTLLSAGATWIPIVSLMRYVFYLC